MGKLNIKKGISLIGNGYNENLNIIDIANDGDTPLNSVKRVVNGKWTSWTKDTPDKFNDFIEIEKGVGYVVNSEANVSVDITDTPVDINDITIGNDICSISLPYSHKKVSNGYLPRMKVNSVKRLNGDNWQTWSSGIPDSFQDFNVLEKGVGYLCDISKSFDKLLNTDVRDTDTGVVLGSRTMNSSDRLLDVTNELKISNPEDIKSIEFDKSKLKDIKLDKVTYKKMYLSFDDVDTLIEFPEPLNGEMFRVSKALYDGVDNGGILEGKTEIIRYGGLGDTAVGTVDYGDLSGSFIKSNESYIGTFKEARIKNEPVKLESKVDLTDVEIFYDMQKKLAGSTIAMLVNCNGKIIEVEFDKAYVDVSFILIVNDVSFKGIFEENKEIIKLKEVV